MLDRLETASFGVECCGVCSGRMVACYGQLRHVAQRLPGQLAGLPPGNLYLVHWEQIQHWLSVKPVPRFPEL